MQTIEQIPVYKRLPLSKVKNIRDLGGYRTSDGRMTRYQTFIRSEVPLELSEEDVQFLLNYGVKTSLDLRSIRESERKRSALADRPDITYRVIPMNSLIATMGATGEDLSSVIFTTWGDAYCRMIDTETNWCRQVVEAFAAAEPCCHFHCTTGKDRTGLASMFLLSLAGVAKEDIIADYSISQVFLKEKFLTMHHMDCISGGDIHHPVFQTSPSNMEMVIDYVTEHFGTVENYLRSCGVAEHCFEDIRRKFVV